MYLGIDIGSAASKMVLVNEKLEVKYRYIKNLGVGVSGDILNDFYKESGLLKPDIKYSVATGYGRLMFDGADAEITEISCHAKGVSHLVKGAKTLLDIGGQDAKVTELGPEGSVENFAMNDKCAAGTGRFLELMSHVLGCKVHELSDLAQQSDKAVHISNTCTVFAESEVISRLAAGESKTNIARGLHASIANKIIGLVKRADGGPLYVMTGGVAQNKDVVSEISKALGQKILVPDHPQMVGAYGAAIFARNRSMNC